MDGEAVYSGEGTTADTCKSLLKAEYAMNEVLRDPPHGGESLQDDMCKEFPYVLEILTIVKQPYSHLSFKGFQSTHWNGTICCFNWRRIVELTSGALYSLTTVLVIVWLTIAIKHPCGGWPLNTRHLL